MKSNKLGIFYKGKKILITGGCGFIGSNVAHALVKMGARVTVVDALLPLYGGNLFNLQGIKSKIQYVRGDIRDSAIMNQLVRGKDLIFHFAAQVSHSDSVSDPLLDIDINCLGTLNLLEACRHGNLGAKIIFSSSRFVYGKILRNPVIENHPVNPLNVYGIHKLTSEKYFNFYWNNFGIRSVIVRIPNPYGPRQQMKHSKYALVGWFNRLAMDGKAIRIFGDGKQKRDYIYIDDLVCAFLMIGANEISNGQIYNVGSAESVSIAQLADLIIRLVKNGTIEHVSWPSYYKGVETGDYIADISKMYREIGWKPQYTMRDGITAQVDFYKKYKEKYWIQ